MGSLAVSRALGDGIFKSPQNKADADFVSALPFINRHLLTPCDQILILACDGLWDVMTYEEAIELADKCQKDGKDAEETSKFLVREALSKGSLDNLTEISKII
jgi:serine/threonine protein phosphatase PrpC